MTLRPPDWERRLRDLERRADNRGTDIVRLWQGLPQAPELPGYAMPVIIPSSTTPTPTTTTTSTSTTTTSTTTTSTTSTTPPPLPCFTGFPSYVTVSIGPITGSACGLNNFPGNWSLNPHACGSSPSTYSIHYRAYINATQFIDMYIGGYFGDQISGGIILNGGIGGSNASAWYYDPASTPANLAALKAALLGRTGTAGPAFWSSLCSGPSMIPFNFSSIAIP